MATAPRPISLEEFLELPDEEPALEYIDGKVMRKVSPKARHSLLQLEIAVRINAAARTRKIALAFPELRTTFAGQSRVPDVAVFRWDRVAREANGEPSDDVYAPPDVAIDIVSPKQSRRVLYERARWYVANGVAIALLVDPDERSVIAFGAGGSVRELRNGDRIELGDVVPDLRLKVGQLFDALRQ